MSIRYVFQTIRKGEVENLDLNEGEEKIFKKASEKFNANTDCWKFHSWAWNTPLTTKNPLWHVLQDMWLTLGVKQGEVADG